MKTKDKILLSSLQLFNDQAEVVVTTVDIANELEISPGNLYYHFKGKEVIIGALLKQHLEALNHIMSDPGACLESLEDHWMFFYVISEQVFDYRFIYRNPSELSVRFPELKRAVIQCYHKTELGLERLVQAMIEKQMLEIDSVQLVPLCQNLNLILNQWFSYTELTTKVNTPKQAIHSMVYQFMQLLIPFAKAPYQQQLLVIQSGYYEV